MAVPLVARSQPQLPARVGEGRIQHPPGKRGCEPPGVGCTGRMSTPWPQDGVPGLRMSALLPMDPASPHCHPPTAAGCPHTHPAACEPLTPSLHPGKELGLVSLPTPHPQPPWVFSLGCGKSRCASGNSFPILSLETCRASTDVVRLAGCLSGR